MPFGLFFRAEKTSGPNGAKKGYIFGNEHLKKVAANAVDKDLTTVTNIDDAKTGDVWLKLEFDNTYFIGEVTIYHVFYTDWFWPSSYFTKSISNFNKYVDTNTNIDVSVYQGDVKQKSCGTLQLTYGLEQSDQIYTLICNAEGDTVKLSKKAGNIVVTEVVVLSGTRRIHDAQGKSLNYFPCNYVPFPTPFSLCIPQPLNF